MANEKIKHLARNGNISQWRIALELNISEATLTRWLRTPLSAERERMILEAIQKLEKEG